jgi:hypothetical protein
MRKLDIATNIHKDFVSVRSRSAFICILTFTCLCANLMLGWACLQAVMDVDYSPTGREFVAGSYDRSVRVFAYNGGRSREVYHTKRMQRCGMLRCIPGGCRRVRAACMVTLFLTLHRMAALASQRVCGALQRRWRVRVQRQRGHERAHLEGGRRRADRAGAQRARFPALCACVCVVSCCALLTCPPLVARLQLLPREKKKQAYDAALVARYAHLPEVKRINRCVRPAAFVLHHEGLASFHLLTCTRVRRHRHVPKAIHRASSLRRTMEDSQRRKRDNVIKHSAPGSVITKPARKERLVAVKE